MSFFIEDPKNPCSFLLNVLLLIFYVGLVSFLFLCVLPVAIVLFISVLMTILMALPFIAIMVLMFFCVGFGVVFYTVLVLVLLPFMYVMSVFHPELVVLTIRDHNHEHE
jgi:hypothetical protein